MRDRRKILGVSVDPIEIDKVLHLTNDYINNQCLNVIFFASANSSILAQDSQEFADFVATADLVLPGDKTMEAALFGAQDEKDNPTMLNRYMERLLAKLNNTERSIYLLDEQEDHLFRIVDVIKEKYPKIVVNGTYFIDNEPENMDLLVNDINTIAPDILVILIENLKLKEFLEQYRAKMNVKLCICLDEATEEEPGAILPLGLPKIIESLGLSKIYKGLFNHKKIHNTIVKTIFKKRMKQLNHQKENDNGNNLS